MLYHNQQEINTTEARKALGAPRREIGTFRDSAVPFSGKIDFAGVLIEAVAPFFKKLAKHAPKLKAIAMDMSKSYYPAAQEFLPNVDVVFDHFHVTALLNKALDEVRKDQQQNLSGYDAKVLKGSRFLFLTNYNNLDPKNQTRLEALLAVNEPLYLAHSLKEQFQLFWDKGFTDFLVVHCGGFSTSCVCLFTNEPQNPQNRRTLCLCARRLRRRIGVSDRL